MADRLTIQRFPRGLLGLLGSQVGGDNPSSIAPEVRGIVDLLPFYSLETRVNSRTVAGSLAAPGGTAGIFVVGSGQVFLLWEVSLECVTPAPALTAGSFGVRLLRSSGTTTYHLITPPQVVGPGDFVLSSAHFETPLVMVPGDSLEPFCLSLSAGGPVGPFNLNATWTRINT